MSEASAGGGARAELERRLIQRSLQDEDYRQQLLSEPRAIIEREIGAQLPERVRVVVVEETADTIYLVLPSDSPYVGEGGELSDEAIESLSGAGWAGDR
jgi:Nitrile hydratase, alpha chain